MLEYLKSLPFIEVIEEQSAKENSGNIPNAETIEANKGSGIRRFAGI